MTGDRPPGRPPPPDPRTRIAAATPGLRRPLPPPRAASSPNLAHRVPIQSPELGQPISQESKDAIAESALNLLDEQIQARIVHYKAELETNPELDAITAQVVAQLRQMQEQLGFSQAARTQESKEAIREQQQRTLHGLLQRLFPMGAPSLVIEKRIKLTLRNLARLFFQSELHERTQHGPGQKPETAKVIQHGEQAMYYLLTRYHHRMKNELDNFEYVSDEIRERSVEVLNKLTKDMQDAFLARRSNELKRIVAVFSAVLVDFTSKQLPKDLTALAHEVVQQARSAEGPKAYGYKITQGQFAEFRGAFERRMMTRLVSFAEDELIRRLADTAGESRGETIEFITNPEIFSMILGQLAEGAYEYLCNEGFLDLPPEWVSAQDWPAERAASTP